MPPCAPPIILASASRRRADLLRAVGVPFVQIPSAVDESAIDAPNHRGFAMAAALAKARDVASRAAKGAVVIGADTIVCLDAERLGKPADAAGARAMLERLQGRRHEVLTGLAVCRVGGETAADCVQTAVWLGRIPTDELEAYLRTEEPYDKAGAYAIQGWAGRHVERVEGDWHNVVGLPLQRLLEMLGRFVEIKFRPIPPPNFS